MDKYLNQPVSLSVSGHRLPVRGTLIEIGSDILVLHNGIQYLYVPLVHLQQLSLCRDKDADFGKPPEPLQEPGPELSYRKVLLNAKGMFLEIYISGNQTVHGYVTSIMNDFFVFHSPMFRNLYVAMRHLKMLIPYDPSATPYSLRQETFPVQPDTPPLSRTFDQQLKKFEGKFVVLDLGDIPYKIGLLKSVNGGIIELVTADGTSSFIHLDHAKTVHLP